MKVLVTGGTGFFGRHLVWRLAENGFDVTFTGRNQQAATEVAALARQPVTYQLLSHGSQQAGSLLADCAASADTIIHCAALSSPWGRDDDFYAANIAGTHEIINAARKARIRRLIHISTPSLYFNFTDATNIREDCPLPPPANEYARTKASAEHFIHTQSPCETVIIRPRALFGPWDNTLFPRLLRVMQKSRLPLIRRGSAMMDLTYIDNAVDAISLAMSRDLPRKNVVYNLSNGEPIRFFELLKIISQEFDLPLRTRRIPWRLISPLARGLETWARWTGGIEPIITRYSAGVLAFSQTLDISAIRRDLGYQPHVSILEGIRRHARWWRQQNKSAS